jgi:hypothetical protein
MVTGHPATVEAAGPSFQGSYRQSLFYQIGTCQRVQLVSVAAFYRSLKGLRSLIVGLLSDRPERLESFRSTCYEPTPSRVPLDPDLEDEDPEQDFMEELTEDDLSDWFEDMLAFLGRYNYLTYADLSSTI